MANIYSGEFNFFVSSQQSKIEAAVGVEKHIIAGPDNHYHLAENEKHVRLGVACNGINNLTIVFVKTLGRNFISFYLFFCVWISKNHRMFLSLRCITLDQAGKSTFSVEADKKTILN